MPTRGRDRRGTRRFREEVLVGPDRRHANRFGYAAVAAELERCRKDVTNFRVRGDDRLELAERVYGTLRQKLKGIGTLALAREAANSTRSEAERFAKRLRHIADDLEALGVEGRAAVILREVMAEDGPAEPA